MNWSITTYVVTLAAIVHYFIESQVVSSIHHVLRLDFICFSWHDFLNVIVLIAFLFYTSYVIIRLILYARYAKHKSTFTETKREVYELKPSIRIEKIILDTTSEDYLASFLSSVKVFGYLEKPVLNELASHLVEKKLRKGESLFKADSHDKSFYIVIDGAITVSVEHESPLSSLDSETERVLADIRSGDIVSSLFSILSLLSEGKTPAASMSPSSTVAVSPSLLSLTKRSGSFLHSSSSFSNTSSSVDIKISARAKEDSRLIWIPEDAFRSVTAKFPIAAAHITQVILTRFQRVTFITLYKYLGLAHELVQIERRVAKYTSDTQWSTHLDTALKRRRNSAIANREFIVDWSTSDSQTLQPNSSTLSQMNSRNETVDFESFVINETMSRPAFNHSRRASNKDMICEMFLSLGEKPLKHVIFESICRLIGIDSTLLKATVTYKPIATKVEDVDFLRRSLKRSENLSTNYLLLESSNRPLSDIGPEDNLFSDYANQMKIFRVKPKELLVEKQKKNPGLFFVLDGIIESFMVLGSDHASTAEGGKEYSLVDSLPGSLAGYLSSFISNVSFTSVRAKTHGLVAMLERQVLDQLVDRFPAVFLTLAGRLVAEVTPIVRHIDFALGWMNVDPGQILCRQGHPSDAIYLVLQGRLRSIKQGSTSDMKDSYREDKQYFTMDDTPTSSESTSMVEIISEHGSGESVGELEVLIDMPRQYTVHAIRETEIAVMPKTLFNYLALIYPETTLKIGRLIASKTLTTPILSNSAQSSCQLKNVAIVPIDPFVPIAYFVAKLKEDLLILGSCLVLDNEKITTVLGKHIFSQLGSLKLQNWLAEQENVFDLVLYIADLASSSWTRRCILQADIILFVGIAGNEIPITDYERLVLDSKTTARKELVLLHSQKDNAHKNARKWLKDRPWIMDRHHIRVPFLLPMHDDSCPRKHLNVFHYVSGRLKQYYSQHQDQCDAFSMKRENDFCRLARRLRGRSIGLVLSGGGARGYAHLGLIKALEEAGIQIDMVGGTSIGAFIGALYAQEGWNVGLLSKAKRFAERMSCKWRMILDMTYPVVSWFTGHAFNRAMFTLFSDTQIEDLWINYFCVTTNLTHSVVEIHRSGYLWRYVRASMSLSGFLPPLCDNGSMLLDGGYLNNLPIDVMKSIGAQYVIAIDVGSNIDIGRSDYDDAVSGWWILLQKILGRPVRIPTLEEIQSRLAYVSCHRKLLESKSIDKSYYLRPPVQQFGTLEFGSHKEIVQIGYDYGLLVLKEWQANGTLDILKQDRQNYSKCRRHSI